MRTAPRGAFAGPFFNRWKFSGVAGNNSRGTDLKEPVHTVYNFHDGPIAGIAGFEGTPHYYECEFDEEADEYSDIFRLIPISEPIFQNAMAVWQIWLRWKGAFLTGQTTLETHPALPDDRQRSDQFQQEFQEHLAFARTHGFRAQGRFSHDEVNGESFTFVEWMKLPE